MASSGSSHLQDIDEKFCQCSICLQQYREPKQLPCLHRYCSDCLKQLIERNQGVTVISCPECRDEVTIPTEGVDGFKTDFYMKNIIEYIEIQNSLEPKELRECFDCSKKLNVASYCFKCNGFLCKGCHENHMTKRSLQDHKRHTLSLKDVKSEHMTVEKLSDLKEAPRCETHLKDLCLLCCRTCNDRPICMTCTYGIHKNHDINDVGIIAAGVRERLTKDLKNLSQYNERVLEVPRTVESIKEKLISNIKERKEHLTKMYEERIQKASKKMKKIEEDFNLTQSKIENNGKTKLIEARKQMDQELCELKTKYDKIFDKIKEESKTNLGNLKRKNEEDLQKSKQAFTVLEKEYKIDFKTLDTKQKDGLSKVENISQQINNIIERYKNLTNTGYHVLETRNDWTAVQCIPDICKAIEPLREDIKRTFPELDKLSRIGVSFEIEEDEESPVNIEGFETHEWRIDDITGVDDGSIVITGHNSPSNYQSYITVIKMNGKVMKRKQLKGTQSWSYRFCAYLSEFKIATVCWWNEIGVFDVRDYSYIKKNISDVISSWPKREFVWCVTTDVVNSHIFVGRFQSRDVYVFDDQLNYHHTLTLPEVITCPRDMAVSDGKLLVCDPVNKRAYAVAMEGRGGKVAHELTKPDCGGDDWDPLSVCTDSNGLIYILWKTGTSLEAGIRVIVQYTQDGSQSLTQKEIDSNDARCIATVMANKTEKLSVASWNSQKLHIYTIK